MTDSNSDFKFSNPWKTVSSKLVYTNPWISLREDRVIRPDGNPGIYGVVSSRTAIGIIALDDQDNIYLVGQYRYPTECYSWEIIEGGAEVTESSLETAKRELKEEAGLIATDWQQLGGDVHLSNCFTSEVGQIFIARGLTQVSAEPEGTEVLQIRKIPLAEAIEMVHNGQITDALSMIALMWLDKKNRK